MMSPRRVTVVLASLGLAGGLTAIVPLATAGSGDKEEQGTRPARALFEASLNGDNEIGPNGRRGAGDRNGQGGAVITLRGNRVCYSVVVRDIDRIEAAHIHDARAGRNGGVVFDMAPRRQAGAVAAFSGCKSRGGLNLARLGTRPTDFCVNIHTTRFPAGAVRGQLRVLNPNRR